MFLRIFIVVAVLGAYNVLGASLSVNVTEPVTSGKNTSHQAKVTHGNHSANTSLDVGDLDLLKFDSNASDTRTSANLSAVSKVSKENKTEETVIDARDLDVQLQRLDSNVSDATVVNSTSLDESNKDANKGDNETAREIPVVGVRSFDTDLKLDSSNDTSLNSTADIASKESNRTSSMAGRETDETLQPLQVNATTTRNSTELGESEEAKIAQEVNIVVATNTSELLNSTMEKQNNQTTRQITVQATSEEGTNSTRNGSNPWSALPLFNMLNATLRNTSAALNSSQTARDIGIGVADNSTTSAEDDKMSESSTEIGQKLKQLLEDFEDNVSEDVEISDGISTKKPCTTVSCLISRGCSDTSCNQNN